MLKQYKQIYDWRNYDICKSIDITGLRIVTDKMIKDGSISLGEAEAYIQQARGLLEILTIRNKTGFESKIS